MYLFDNEPIKFEMKMTFGKSLLMLMLAAPGLAIAQQSGPFTVTGSIGKLNAPAKVYLMYADSGKRKFDSATPVNGAFTFKGTIGEETLGNFIVDVTGGGLRTIKRSDVISLFVEPGTIKVVSPDSVGNAKVSGSQLNMDLQALHDVSVKADKDVKAANPNKSDEELADTMNTVHKAVWKQFIKDHPSSKVSLLLLHNFGSSGYIDPAEVQPMFDMLSADLKNSKEGKQFGDMLKDLAKVSVGSVAPDFTQNDTADKPVSLHDFKGKYVLVDFWASWCHPCRMENPNVVKAYQEYKGKNFTIISVSLDRPGQKDAWLKAIHDDGLTWNHVSDLQFWQNQVAQLYAIQSIPQNLLLDPSGKIIAKNLRGEDLAAKLKSLNL